MKMRNRNSSERGATYIEVLVAGILMAFGLLTMANMFFLGYTNVDSAGRTTIGLSAARQLMEDVRRLPYDDLVELHGFDSDNPATLPENGAPREIARRWRYALAGDGVGWDFTNDETTRWGDPSNTTGAHGATGSISVVQQTTTLTEVTLTVTVPGRWRSIRISTLVTRI